MKYSILSVTAFLAVSSLGFPGYYPQGNLNNPEFVEVTNNINHPVVVEYFPQPPHFYGSKVTDEPVIINNGETYKFWTSAQDADLKIKVAGRDDWQAELSYDTAPTPQDTYDFALKPIGSQDFPGYVYAEPVGNDLPPTCHRLQLPPGGEATCPNGVPIRVNLSPGNPPFKVPYYGAGWY